MVVKISAAPCDFKKPCEVNWVAMCTIFRTGIPRRYDSELSA